MIKKIFNNIKRSKDFTEILKGSSLAMLHKIIGVSFNFLLALIATRNLSANAWGIYTINIALISFGMILSTLGFTSYYVKEFAKFDKNKENNDANKFYSMGLFLVLIAGTIVSISFFFLSEKIALLIFKKQELLQTFRWSSLIILPFAIMHFNAACLRGTKNINYFGLIIHSLRAVLPFGILLILLFFVKDSIILIYSLLIGVLITSIISFFLVKKVLGIRIVHFELKKIKYTLKKSLPLLLGQQTYFFKEWIATLVIGVFLPTKSVGVFDIAVRISKISNIILFGIDSISAPKYAENYNKGDIVGLQRIVNQSLSLLAVSSLPIIFFMFFFAEPLLSYFGKDLIGQGVSLLRILLLGQVFIVITGSVSFLLQMTDNQIIFQNLTLVSLITTVVGTYVLIQSYGLFGVVFANLLSIAIFQIGGAIYIYKSINIYSVLKTTYLTKNLFNRIK